MKKVNYISAYFWNIVKQKINLAKKNPS